MSDDIAVVDATTLEVVKHIAVGKRPWGVVVSD
jgi:YVTN family beta-propeller protein